MYFDTNIDWNRKVLDSEAHDIDSIEELEEYIRVLRAKGERLFNKKEESIVTVKEEAPQEESVQLEFPVVTSYY